MRHLPAWITALALATTPLAGCAPEDALEEGALPDVLDDDAKADSLRAPTDFGHLFAWQTQFATLDPAKAVRNISWTFTLGESAEAAFAVMANPASPGPLDLVAYVYKRGTDGKWHKVSKTAVSDGDGLVEINESGEYRMIVKGRKAAQDDRFLVQLGCLGAGCPTSECVFTGWTPDLTHGSVATVVESEYTPDNVDRLGTFNQEQVRVAIETVSGQQPATAAQALELVDDSRIAYREIADDLSGRLYVQIEGALAGEAFEVFFGDDGTPPVARRSADAFTQCDVPADACDFGQSFDDTAGMPGATVGEEELLHEGSTMDELTKDRVLAATLGFRDRNSAGAVAKAFETAGGKVTVSAFTFDRLGKVVRVSYEDAAGPMGAYFVDSDDPDAAISPVASLEAGAIRNCTTP
jgi:hypothetical protein